MTAQKFLFQELQWKTTFFFPGVPIDNRSDIQNFSYFEDGLNNCPNDFICFITPCLNTVKNAPRHCEDHSLKHYQNFYPLFNL